MNIIELVKHLKKLEDAETFVNEKLPDIEYDLVDIYMVDKLSLDSSIVFFDAEKISNKLIIEVNGVTYVNLFPLNMTQELVEEFSLDKITDREIAERLLKYREKDA